ncbi:MAG: YceI family protein [Myxococcales bacterium]|nr:YceI family protein [Myxococcales bacterium]
MSNAWTIDKSRSAIHVKARSTLHDSKSVGTLSGTVSGDPDALEATAGGVVDIPIADFDFGNRLQTSAVLGKLDVDKYPLARFRVDGVRVLSKSPWRVQILGKLDYRNRQTPFEVEATGRFDERTLDARASFPLNLPSIGVKPPSLLFFKVADDVQVDLQIVATRQA